MIYTAVDTEYGVEEEVTVWRRRRSWCGGGGHGVAHEGVATMSHATYHTLKETHYAPKETYHMLPETQSVPKETYNTLQETSIVCTKRDLSHDKRDPLCAKRDPPYGKRDL